MGRRRPTADALVLVASAIGACALLWWLLAARSQSPILARVGVPEGDVRNAAAATDRIRLAETPSSEPVARLASGAALRWSWNEPTHVRAIVVEGAGNDRYEIAMEPAVGDPIVASWWGGGASGFARSTVAVDAELVGLAVRAVGSGNHRLSELTASTRPDAPARWAPWCVALVALPALWVASGRRTALAAALALGVAWRAQVVLGRGLFATLDGDAVGYLARGMALFTSAPGEALWPPGTHVFFGLLWAIDPTWNALVVAQVVLSATLPILGGYIAGRVGGPTATSIAVAALALWWPLVGLTQRLWSQTLFAFLLAASTVLVLEGSAILGGITLGAAIATRSEAILFASIPFAVLASARPAAALRVAIGTLLVLVPTALRATSIAGAPTLVATNPALHVATAWWTRVSPDRLARADADFGVAWEIVRADPIWALGQAGASTVRAFTDGAMNAWSVAAIVATGIAAIGAIRRPTAGILLLWPLAGVVVLSAVAVGASRYRVPTDPFTLALAASAISASLAWPARGLVPATPSPSASGASAPRT
jgi:hypothetical protein